MGRVMKVMDIFLLGGALLFSVSVWAASTDIRTPSGANRLSDCAICVRSY